MRKRERLIVAILLLGGIFFVGRRYAWLSDDGSANSGSVLVVEGREQEVVVTSLMTANSSTSNNETYITKYEEIFGSREENVMVQTTNSSISSTNEVNATEYERPSVAPVINDNCPAAIRNHQGVYRSNATGITDDTRKGLQNTVLLTGSNMQFERFLSNWEILAGEKGLTWALLAFDNETYVSRGGPSNSILLENERQPTEKYVGTFRSPSYNKLVCNKIRMVKTILRDCKVNVVFSDADSVFLRDPFQHDLGNMILSQRYDYIYQANDYSPGAFNTPRNHSCITQGKSSMDGNTGFHYLRSNIKTDRILQATLRRCDRRNNGLDDQALFWHFMQKSIERFKTWKHCPPHDYRNFSHQPSMTQPNDDDVAVLCCLDPYYYRTGQKEPLQEQKDDIVVYHANFAREYERKEQKLRKYVNGGWRLSPSNMTQYHNQTGF